MKLLIRNAIIYDPKNGVNGEVHNIYIRDGRISKPFKTPNNEIDASGFWALPGGIEVGTSLYSYGLPFYGFQQGLPSSKEISTFYARMGYTHLHESIMFPSTSPAVHHFLSSITFQDTSASLCLTLREFGTLIGLNTLPEWTVRLLDTCAQRFRALNIRLTETSAHFRESTLSRFNIPSKRVLEYIAQLPLNIPFFIESTSRLMDEDLPGIPQLYYSHIGRAIDGEYALKQISSHMSSKGIMGDMGLTPDAPHHQAKIEAEVGKEERLAAYIGTHSPLRYMEESPTSQTSYVINLATNPDFKNNLAFSSLCLGAQAGKFYPPLFKKLFETTESYTVGDFVLQTRVLPALMLGLEDKGHLGIGAMGDIALYKPDSNLPRGELLSQCHTLIKGGTLVMENGRFLTHGASPDTRTYYRSHTPSERDFAMFASYFKAYSRLEHLEVPDPIGRWHPVPIK